MSYLKLESITIKVPKEMAKEIDEILTPYYGTRTEFIREAIRDKLRTINAKRINLLNKRKNE